jgi:AraC family transcriptional regulator of arabinose operon
MEFIMAFNESSSHSYNSVDIELEPDLHLREYGYEDFSRRKSDRFYHKKLYHIFQIVARGQGYYFLNGIRHTVKQGDVFYLPPDTPIMHYESKSDPYLYYWFSLFGEKTKNILADMPLSILSPVHALPGYDKVLAELKALLSETQSLLSVKGHVYTMLAHMTESGKSFDGQSDRHRSILFQEILDFISINYSQMELQVQKLLDLFHLTQTQLYRLFIEHLDLSPKQYLLNYRMEKATEMLAKNYSVTLTAESVGYQNIYHFSRQFKRHFGFPPADSKYRKPE